MVCDHMQRQYNRINTQRRHYHAYDASEPIQIKVEGMHWHMAAAIARGAGLRHKYSAFLLSLSGPCQPINVRVRV